MTQDVSLNKEFYKPQLVVSIFSCISETMKLFHKICNQLSQPSKAGIVFCTVKLHLPLVYLPWSICRSICRYIQRCNTDRCRVGQYTDTHIDVTLTVVWVSQYTDTHRDVTLTGVGVGQYTDTHRDVTLTVVGLGQYTDTHRDVTLTGVGVSQYTDTHRDVTLAGVGVSQYTDTHRDVTLTGVGVSQYTDTHSDVTLTGMCVHVWEWLCLCA